MTDQTDQADIAAFDAPVPDPEVITLTNTRPDGSQVDVALIPPPEEWWKQVRPGQVCAMQVVAVRETNVRNRKPVVPESAEVRRAPRRAAAEARRRK